MKVSVVAADISSIVQVYRLPGQGPRPRPFAVDFIDSSTIRMFINLHKRLELAGKRLCLLHLRPRGKGS